MVFNEINSCFALLINLEMWQPFVHLFLKILTFLCLEGLKKVLMYQ